MKERLMSCGLSADPARPGELSSSGVLLSKKVIGLGLLGFLFHDWHSLKKKKKKSIVPKKIIFFKTLQFQAL